MSAFFSRLLAIAVLVVAAAAQGPTTVQDPAITLADLGSQLVPLRRAELKLEADGWTELVEATCKPIADQEVAARAVTDPAQRQPLLDAAAGLTTERTARIDRLLAVVAELEKKGGAAEVVAEYRQYAGAVSGLKVDVTDTSAAWTAIKHWLQAPEGGLRVGKNILFFLLTLLAFRFLGAVASRITARALRGFKRSSDLLRDFFANSVGRVVFFIGIVLALSMLEVDIGPFLAAIGAAGFVIGFALQGTLSNFASGIMILLYRPYDIGDYVSVAGVAGTVEAMTLVSTSVKSPDNQLIVIPNGSIWGGIITNVTGKAVRRVDLKFGIAYSDDIGKAERVLAAILAEHPLVLEDPAPVVKVHELGDSSVNFVVRPWTKTSDYWTVYWDITRTVKERFDAAGVSIPFPQRDVHVYGMPAAT